MPESAGPGVVHFFTFDTLWATSGTGNIIPFWFFFFPMSYLLWVDPGCMEQDRLGWGCSHTGHNELWGQSL